MKDEPLLSITRGTDNEIDPEVVGVYEADMASQGLSFTGDDEYYWITSNQLTWQPGAVCVEAVPHSMTYTTANLGLK